MLPILSERKRIPQFKMDSDGIVPDVIDVLPTDIMEVSYRNYFLLIHASVLFCIKVFGVLSTVCDVVFIFVFVVVVFFSVCLALFFCAQFMYKWFVG